MRQEAFSLQLKDRVIYQVISGDAGWKVYLSRIMISFCIQEHKRFTLLAPPSTNLTGRAALIHHLLDLQFPFGDGENKSRFYFLSNMRMSPKKEPQVSTPKKGL